MPQQYCHLEGIPTLFLKEQPENVTFEYELDADEMPTQAGGILFQIDWEREISSMTMVEASTKKGAPLLMPNPLSSDP